MTETQTEQPTTTEKAAATGNRTMDRTVAVQESRPRGAVLLLCEEDDEPGFAEARQYAADLAQLADADVVLYYRSEETWADTPHPEGPLSLGDNRLDDRDYLRTQMQEIAAAGVRPLAWVPTLPTVTAIEKVLDAITIGHVVVPESMSRKMLERVLTGDSLGSTIRMVLDRRSDSRRTVVDVVSADGGIVTRLA